MITQYFWDQKGSSLKETYRILKNPAHPQFPQRMTELLTRCSRPKELFSVISQERFVQSWPRVRAYWIKRLRWSEARDWWQTIYEQLAEGAFRRSARIEGGTPDFLRNLGNRLKEARIERGLSQRQLALQVGVKQPDISRMEEGKKNITLFTLVRICKVLGIRSIDIV
jgi:DNA-binding XRE family transcriptional regulator